ncbi:MAG: DUF4159 domain-containing protein [Lentisphaerae bacterium]|nr:DUF4159 domain-containing protein [Lentisphaerota bacterium]
MRFDLESKIEALEKLAESKRLGRLLLPLLRSRYFLISLVFYLSLLLVFAGYKVSSYIAIRGSFDEGALLVLPPAAPQQPQKQKTESKVETKEIKVATTAENLKNKVTRITTMAPSEFVRPDTPQPLPVMKMAEIKLPTEMSKRIEASRIARLQGVAKFQKEWNVQNSGRQTKAKFTIYQAKYADGDWNCNPSALHNMMLQIRAWSKDRIDARIHPEVLDIGTDQIFTIKPPFIYLTGHKNFRFQENEVKNLRDYLLLGGCVWADSALAGRRSRFDVAFRREIARVLPDREFEIVPENHEMFDTFFEKIGLPSGMNYYDEPVEMINIDGKLAVLYSLNGYGHLWEARLNRDGKIEWQQVYVGKPEDMGKKNVPYKWRYWRHVYGPHLAGGHYQRVIYRNLNDETTRNSYKFGINVVVHLLTRYQRELMLLPKELPTGPDLASRLAPTASTNVAATATNQPAEEEAPEPKTVPGARRITTKQSDRNF